MVSKREQMEDDLFNPDKAIDPNESLHLHPPTSGSVIKRVRRSASTATRLAAELATTPKRERKPRVKMSELAERIDYLTWRIERIEATGGATNEDMLGAYDALRKRLDSLESSMKQLGAALSIALDKLEPSDSSSTLWKELLEMRRRLNELLERLEQLEKQWNALPLPSESE